MNIEEGKSLNMCRDVMGTSSGSYYVKGIKRKKLEIFFSKKLVMQNKKRKPL